MRNETLERRARWLCAGTLLAVFPWLVLGLLVSTRSLAIAFVTATFALGVAWIAAGVTAIRAAPNQASGDPDDPLVGSTVWWRVGLGAVVVGLGVIVFAVAILPITYEMTWEI